MQSRRETFKARKQPLCLSSPSAFASRISFHPAAPQLYFCCQFPQFCCWFITKKQSVLQFHLTSNQFNSLLQWERRRAVTFNNNGDAVLRGVATRSFVLLKEIIILRDLERNFPNRSPNHLGFYLLFYSKPKHDTLVHRPLPPSGPSICPLLLNG